MAVSFDILSGFLSALLSLMVFNIFVREDQFYWLEKFTSHPGCAQLEL